MPLFRGNLPCPRKFLVARLILFSLLTSLIILFSESTNFNKSFTQKSFSLLSKSITFYWSFFLSVEFWKTFLKTRYIIHQLSLLTFPDPVFFLSVSRFLTLLYFTSLSNQQVILTTSSTSVQYFLIIFILLHFTKTLRKFLSSLKSQT